MQASNDELLIIVPPNPCFNDVTASLYVKVDQQSHLVQALLSDAGVRQHCWSGLHCSEGHNLPELPVVLSTNICSIRRVTMALRGLPHLMTAAAARSAIFVSMVDVYFCVPVALPCNGIRCGK